MNEPAWLTIDATRRPLQAWESRDTELFPAEIIHGLKVFRSLFALSQLSMDAENDHLDESMCFYHKVLSISSIVPFTPSSPGEGVS